MTAVTDVSCYTLKRQAFVSLLGPIENVWRLEALRKVSHSVLSYLQSNCAAHFLRLHGFTARTWP